MIIRPDSPDITLRCGRVVMYDHGWDDSVFFDIPDFIDPDYPDEIERECRFTPDGPYLARAMVVK